MTSRRFYLVALAAFALGLVAIVAYPDTALAVLIVLVPLAVLGAVVAVLYMWWVYRRQPTPRSRFFRMALETFGGLLLVGGWVAYLSVARVVERAHAAGDTMLIIPAPPPPISSPISALLVVVVFAGVMRFGAEVYLVRRRPGRAPADDDVTADT